MLVADRVIAGALMALSLYFMWHATVLPIGWNGTTGGPGGGAGAGLVQPGLTAEVIGDGGDVGACPLSQPPGAGRGVALGPEQFEPRVDEIGAGGLGGTARFGREGFLGHAIL